MFKNLLKFSFRSPISEKGYKLINISGLKTCITCCLFLLLYIVDKLTYEPHDNNTLNLYRVAMLVRETNHGYSDPAEQRPLSKAVAARQEYNAPATPQDVSHPAPFSFEARISINSLPTLGLQTRWGRVRINLEWKVPMPIWSPARYAALFVVIGVYCFSDRKEETVVQGLIEAIRPAQELSGDFVIISQIQHLFLTPKSYDGVIS